jgi:PKD repeat protein
MGCDEYWPDSITGALLVAISPEYTVVGEGIYVSFMGLIEGRTHGNSWDWGDGTVSSNQVHVSHVWSGVGAYTVILTAFNDTYPEGISATAIVEIVGEQYVSPSGTHVSPFVSWHTAATSIQSAVDVEVPGVELILVTNGVYDTGGRAVYGSMTNRVAIDRPITVRSVNGPEVTTIEGQGPLGNGAYRCAYVASNAVLDGFTLTNGYTRTTGNAAKEMSGGGVWCEEGAVVSNCIVVGNHAEEDAGGAYGGALFNCIIANNEAGDDGAGAYRGSASYCELRNNIAINRGGGANECVLRNCIIAGNSAFDGGGAHGGDLSNCLVYDNEASDDGGGVDEASIVNNCTIVYNVAADEGGGIRDSVANNCIAWYNTAAVGDNHFQCTVSFSCATPKPTGTGNISEDPIFADAAHLGAGSPCIGQGSPAYTTNGVDIDGEAWADPPSMGCDEYVAGGATGELSVAIEAESTRFVNGLEVTFRGFVEGRASGHWWDWGDGSSSSNQLQSSHAWSTPGTYDVTFTAVNDTYPSGVVATVTVNVTNLPIHYVNWSNSTPESPYTTWSTAATNIQDAVDAAVEVGAIVMVTNGVYDNGGRAVHGSMTNRVVIDRPITVCSVNGPTVTSIKGKGPKGNSAIRCAYVGTNAVLSGFTLTNGFTRKAGDFATEQGGGGIWCEGSALVTNCVIAGCSSTGDGGGAYKGRLIDCTLQGNDAGDDGGGAYKGELDSCTLKDNHADDHGGGANGGILRNCTITGNTAYDGGGAHEGELHNCIVSGNSASDDGGGIDEAIIVNNCLIVDNSTADEGGGVRKSVLNNCTIVGNNASEGSGASRCTVNNSILWNNPGSGGNWLDSTLSSSCTTPLPPGSGNIADDPQFVADGDFHLMASSPCIGAGSNALASGSTDLDGLPRIIGGTVDMGAYEAESQGFSPVHYVSPVGANQYPYTNWAGAATTIQVAIDVAQSNDLVLVTNGVYNTGGAVAPGHSLSNRVSMTKPITLQSVEGSGVTVIDGAPGSNGGLDTDAVRGVFMTAGSSLAGFTVTNGHTHGTSGDNVDQAGGGIFLASGCVVSNCILAGNSAVIGGGAYHEGGGVLSNCTVSGDEALDYGGAVYLDVGGSILDCVVSNNSADLYGGGVRIYLAGEMRDCLVVSNYVGSVGGGVHIQIGGTVDNCTFNNNTAYSGGGGAGLTVGGILSNCTLTANTATGALWTSGGGVFISGGGQLVECTLTGNSSGHGGGVFLVDDGSLARCRLTDNTADQGGGAYLDSGGLLADCLLAGNLATFGGGASLTHFGELTGCTLTGNSADSGGGVGFLAFGTLENCIVWGNTGSNGANIHNSGTVLYCCALGGLTHGLNGCITNDPQFISSNDYHLAASSPCIDAGSNSFVATSIDLDELTRIVNGTVDMGAYEYQWPDTDGDGLSDRHEYFAGTSDTNPASCFVFEDITPGGSNGVVISWQGIEGKQYGLYRSTNLFVEPLPIQTNIPGVEPMNTVTDTTAVGYGPWYYRVWLE